MPIRFRCVYCDKLLGIARRKAGTIVDCPHCKEKLIVPSPEIQESLEEQSNSGTNAVGASTSTSTARSSLIDDIDFDKLDEYAQYQEPLPPNSASPNYQAASAGAQPFSYVPQTYPGIAPSINNETNVNHAEILPTTRHSSWSLIITITLILCAFGSGILVGKYLL